MRKPMKTRIIVTAIMLIGAWTASVHADGDVTKGAKVYKKTGCAACHNPDAMGKAKPDALDKQKGPQIAGLDPAYAAEQIAAIASKKRATETSVDMQKKVATLTPDQIKDVAAYVGTLAPRHKGMKE